MNNQDTERAALDGAIAACRGLPLHTVADSGHRARSACGDAWERGWQYAAEQFSSLSEVGQGISRGVAIRERRVRDEAVIDEDN